MKLYTEEQIRKAMNDYANTSSDLDNVMDVEMAIIEQLTPIELPSDEQMANASNHCKDGQVKVGFLRGVIWMKDQILNQSK